MEWTGGGIGGNLVRKRKRKLLLWTGGGIGGKLLRKRKRKLLL